MQKLQKILKTKNARILIGIVCIMVILSALFLFLQRQNPTVQQISDAGDIKLYLTPASATLNKGQETEVTLKIDTKGKNVGAIIATIEYNTSLLSYNGATYANTIVNDPTNSIDIIADNNKLVVFIDVDPTFPINSTNGNMVNLQFQTKNTDGVAAFSFVNKTEAKQWDSSETEITLNVEGIGASYTIGNVSSTTAPTGSVSLAPSITNSAPGEGANRCLPTGDVDINGVVNNADLSLLKGYLDGNKTLTPVQMGNANLSGSTSSKEPTERDYDYLKLLIEGRGAEVFPGNPPICPYVHNVYVAFSDRNVTLNENNLSPTKNKIVIYNPEKKKISHLYMNVTLPSNLARITNITPLNGLTFTNKNVSAGGASFMIHNIPTTNPPEVFELVEIDVVPWTIGNTTSKGTMEIKGLMMFDDQNQNAGLKFTDRYGVANYTVIRSSTITTTQVPPQQITEEPTQAITVTPINASPPVGGGSVRISATLPAIGTAFASDNKNPIEPTRQVQIQLTNSTSGTPITASGTLTFNGNEYVGYVLIPTITPGNYQIKARLSNTLYKTIPGIYNLQDTSSVNTSTVALNSGDVNQDNRIDIFDYNIILGCVQKKTTCTASLKALSDLDSDGLTDKDDYNIFLTQLAFREGD